MTLLVRNDGAFSISGLEGWSSWTGLPAPLALLPQMSSLVGYGTAFGFGWLAHRQMHRLLALDSVVLGTSHPYFASHLENLGFVYQYAGFLDSTKLVTTRAFEIRKANLADDNPAIGRSLFNLAALEYERGAYQAAEPLYQEAVSRMRRSYGPEHTDVVYATGAMGRNQYYLGRTAEARKNLGWAVAETIAINWGASASNEYTRNQNFTQLNPRSMWANFEHGFTFDDNQFKTNQLVHPFNGSTYYNAGRTNGFGFWASSSSASRCGRTTCSRQARCTCRSSA